MEPLCTCRLLTYTNEDLTVVHLEGDRIYLDEMDAICLQDSLQKLVESGRYRLSIDLGNVVFLTSTMVETLLSLHRQLKAVGGHLSVSNLTPVVAEIFAVLKLTTILDVRSSFR